MTVPAPGPLTYSYSEDGVTTIFAYPVRFIEAQELVVMRTVDGIATTLTMGVDYTVSGEGNPAGGSITRTAATNGGTITIYRDTTWKQIVDLEDKQRNPAQAVEDQLDRLTMAGQDARAAIGVLQNKTGDLDDAVARAEAAKEDAEVAKSSAEAAQAAAEAARDEALAAVPNAFPEDRTALKALDTNSITAAYLKEQGREGQFVWRTGDYSSQVAADTAESIYIKADDVAATDGAWVREKSNLFTPEQFGAIGDGRRLDHAWCDAGSTTIEVSAGLVSEADIGKVLVLPMAGPFATPLVTTIVGATSSSLTVSDPTSFAVLVASLQDGYIATDSTEALKGLISVAPVGATLQFNGKYLCQERLFTDKAFYWQGLHSEIMFPNTDGIWVDRRLEKTAATARYEGLQLLTAASPGSNRTALRLSGPIGNGTARNQVDRVVARGISGGFILNSAWGNGLALHNASFSHIKDFSMQGLSLDSTKPQSYYGIIIENSTYVIIDAAAINFCNISVAIVAGAPASEYVNFSGTEAIIIRDSHLVFCDVGIDLRNEIGAGGTYFDFKGTHIDAFRRGVFMLGYNAAFAQSQLTDLKIHMNYRSDYAGQMRYAAEILATDVLVNDNKILYYPDSEPETRGGIKFGTLSGDGKAFNNDFLFVTAGAFDVSDSPGPIYLSGNTGENETTGIIDPSGVVVRGARNLLPNEGGAYSIDQIALCRNISGGAIANGATIAGTGLAIARFTGGVIDTGANLPGTWKNIDGFPVANLDYAYFMRVY